MTVQEPQQKDDAHTELRALRGIVETQKNNLDLVNTQVPDVDLQEQSAHAALEFTRKNFPDFKSLDSEEQTTLFNTAAAMFSIGVRWREGMAAGGHLKIYKKEGAKS